MRLTVVGCAGTFPGPDSPCSSYLIEHDGYRLVLDLDPGTPATAVECAEVALLLRDLVLPDFRDYAVEVERPATGFVAFYGELDFEIDGLRHQLSTQVRVAER